MIPGGASPTCGTGIHFTGLPKVLELVLTNGVDKRTGKQVYKVNNIQMDVWRKYNMPAVNSLP